MFLTENQFRDALHWYQKKIGSYDQQVWEKSIEERVLRGLSHAIPKKVARVKKESIDLDLDLIRGSYFAKAKPQQSWLTTTYLGIVRILLFPFYLNWWTEQTNPLICAILFILYCLQMLSMYIYFNSEKEDFDEIPISEVVSPLFMFFILGTMQSQIGASSSSKNRSYRSRLNCSPATPSTSTSNLTTTAVTSSPPPPPPPPPPSSSISTLNTHSSVKSHNNISNNSSIDCASSKNVDAHHRLNSSASKLSIRQKSAEVSTTAKVKPASTLSKPKDDNSNLTIGLCKDCFKRDSIRETNASNKKDKQFDLPATSSSSLNQLESDSSSNVNSKNDKKINLKGESKISDDESGLDSMEAPDSTPKEEDDDDNNADEEEEGGEEEEEERIEGEDEEELEICLRRRKILKKHNDNLAGEEDDDDGAVSDNSSTPGSSPSVDQSPSPSTSSSTKSTPGYLGRQKSFPHRSQKLPEYESAERNEYQVKKEINTDTEPDETIGDLSSADECSPYSTVDSNNRFEWSRKYNIISPTTGIPIDLRDDSRSKSSPVRFRLSESTATTGPVNGDKSKIDTNLNLAYLANPANPASAVANNNNKNRSSNKNISSSGYNNSNSVRGHRSIISKIIKSSAPSSSSSNHHRLQFRLPVSCSKSQDACSSSGESECSMSPASPITKLASDLDWPSINSDGTSDDEGEMMMGVDVDVTNSLQKLNENAEFFNFCEETTRSMSQHNSNNHNHSHREDHHHRHHRHHHHHHHHHQFHHHHHTPSVSYSPEETSSYNQQRNGKTFNDKVSCAIWQMRECQKVDLSVLDISSAIIRKVESVKHSNEYFYLGFLLSLVLAFIPVIFRIRQFATSTRFSETRRSKVVPTSFSNPNSSKEILSDIIQEIPTLATDLLAETMVHSFSSLSVQFVVLVAIIERFFLSLCFFFLLCVAERTFRERFLYAKYFCHLTSSRRARRSDLPHFRLNKVRNIKTWLSVRSYLQNHGPQRSIDAIVSSSFIVEVSILTFLCIQLLRDNEICSEKLYCWEMVFWNLAIGLYIMRLIILGSKMNRKNRGCLTILLSEQINLYLQLEQKPHKKEDLTLANQLIKSAADVLKLLEAPFKISGFSANPYLYNITKVIVLSAFSAVLTELLGFKLKLYKIKLTS